MSTTRARVRRSRTKLTDRRPPNRAPYAPALGLGGPWRPRGPRRGLRFVDFLCGAGGASAGLANAGWDLVFGANHWQPAIDTHQANFPDVWHECVDVTTINLRRLPRAHALWISPICTECSPAGGLSGGWKESEASQRGQGSLFSDGPVEQAGMEKTRATFWEAIRYAEMWQPEIVFVENVPDVVIKWKLFKNWLGCMEDLGYEWQMINVNSAHIGDLAEGIPYAPQWRDRLYLVFVRKDIGRTHDFTPSPMAYCFECRETVQGVQTWCPAAQNRWLKAGRYRRDPNTNYGSYWYTCPRGCRDGRGERARVEPFVLPILGSIDWADLGSPIGENRLGANTLRRVAIGQHKLWTPDAQTFGTLDPFLTVLRNHGEAQGLDLPVPSVTTSGNNLSVVFPNEAHGAFTVKHNGGEADPWNLSRPISEPLGTVCSTGGKQALVLPYYSDDEPYTPGVPLGTVSTRDRHALITADSADVPLRACNYRLLKPVESARAQVLPVDDGYVITGTEEEQKAQIGNAVTSNASQWLGLGAAEILQAA